MMAKPREFKRRLQSFDVSPNAIPREAAQIVTKLIARPEFDPEARRVGRVPLPFRSEEHTS